MSENKEQIRRELMRKQTEELIRHRLSYLPEIKKEIQHYLEISQTNRQSSNLKKSLSRLEGFPDISKVLEENDPHKISPIFGEFERTKSIARVEILAIRTNLALGLNNWHIGKHALRDVNGVKTGEFDVMALWASNIVPDTHWLSFQLPARITAVHSDSSHRVAFGLGTSLDDFSTSIVQTELPQNWTDPLKDSLHHLELFPGEGKRQISLNGIFYELYTYSWASQSLIEFGNPEIMESKSFAEIERSLFSIAAMIINEKGQQPEKEFLSIWQKCLVKSKNA
ncbi:MAG TPA: hypothetical protein VFR47_10115 [Anaerolineales bacterium]|nr:hypothetical protein [Anaerolineales bacterium]